MPFRLSYVFVGQESWGPKRVFNQGLKLDSICPTTPSQYFVQGPFINALEACVNQGMVGKSHEFWMLKQQRTVKENICSWLNVFRLRFFCLTRLAVLLRFEFHEDSQTGFPEHSQEG